MRYHAGHEKYQKSYMALARLLRRPWLEVKAEVDRASMRIMNNPDAMEIEMGHAYVRLHASTPKRQEMTCIAIIEAIKTNQFVLDMIAKEKSHA